MHLPLAVLPADPRSVGRPVMSAVASVAPVEAAGIFHSAEFWAALFGAGAAFLLEALRRWLSERRHERAIGNQALFVFVQMYATLSDLQKAIHSRVQLLQSREGRVPHYFEYPAMGLVWNEDMRLPIDRLGFLLQSYDPDLLNRMARVESSFFTILYTLEKRTTAHMEFTNRAEEKFGENLPIPIELERGIGPDIAMRSRDLTNSLLEQLPSTIDQIPKVGKQLAETLSLIFPLSPPIGSDFAVYKFTADPPSGAKPPQWRQSLRDAVRWVKRRIKRATTAK
jgi:hypothetical protein